MPLTSIVTIVLRLFALNWLLQGAFLLSSATTDFVHSNSFFSEYWRLAPLAGLVVAGILLFFWSHLLARIVTPRPHQDVAFGSLTQYDLYCFAFTFLGLYFALSSIANTLNWLHYFLLVMRDTHENNPQRSSAFYEVTRPLITLIAGCACLLFAPRCARKLTDVQNKHNTA